MDCLVFNFLMKMQQQTGLLLVGLITHKIKQLLDSQSINWMLRSLKLLFFTMIHMKFTIGIKDPTLQYWHKLKSYHSQYQK